jgi:hypothetical protein
MPPALPPQVNKGPGLIAVTWIEASIGLLLLAARLYTRARIVRNVGWDDWIMIFATVSRMLHHTVRILSCNTGVSHRYICHRYTDGALWCRPACCLH